MFYTSAFCFTLRVRCLGFGKECVLRLSNAFILIALLLLLGLFFNGSTVQAVPKTKQAKPALVEVLDEDFVAVTFQVGTYFLSVAENPVRTDLNRVGDRVEARLSSNVFVENYKVLTPETRFYGYISQLEKPLEGRDAILAIRMDALDLPNGERQRVSTHLDTNSDDHAWGGGLRPGTKPVKVLNKVQYIGDYNRIIYMGPRQMGRHYEVKPGEQWRVVLEQPLQVIVPRHP
jgi:hypothetical protein